MHGFEGPLWHLALQNLALSERDCNAAPRSGQGACVVIPPRAATRGACLEHSLPQHSAVFVHDFSHESLRRAENSNTSLLNVCEVKETHLQHTQKQKLMPPTVGVPARRHPFRNHAPGKSCPRKPPLHKHAIGKYQSSSASKKKKCFATVATVWPSSIDLIRHPRSCHCVSDISGSQIARGS